MLTNEERDVLKKAAEIIVSVTEAGGIVQLRGFGTFKRVDRKAKEARNPQTGAPVMIPARSVLTFKASKALAVEK